jgi:hypothetical protein
MFNTNTLHNVLNIAIAVIGAMGAFDWTVLFSQTTALAIVGALATAKGVINMLRDGFAGMVKPQPPVEQ